MSNKASAEKAVREIRRKTRRRFLAEEKIRIVIVRMRWHEPTRAYVDRRTAEGLSKRDIIRCLKRYVAREVYRLLPRPASATIS